MTSFAQSFSDYATIIVPILTIWAICSLYTLQAGKRCWITEASFLMAMAIIAGCTIRTVAANDACWLVHMSSLGVMVVAGAMKRPTGDDYMTSSDLGADVRW